jgi:hypothetical protein
MRQNINERREGSMAKKKQTDDIEVAVAEVVDYMKITGAFTPALHKVVQRKITANAARKSKIKVSNAELQKAADAFRLANGLNKAKDTERWLKANGITLEALEDYLETNILINKFKDQLQKKASKTKYLKSEGIQESIREMAYQDWLANAMK